MNADPSNDAGFQRTLRHALHTELTLRLRHALLHGLKGPVQTVLSALHLLQKKAAAGETQELDKYGNWIKDAAKDLMERAQNLLPPKPTPAGEFAQCDLQALTEDAAHMLRDEAALKEVDLAIEPATQPAVALGNEGDLRLAMLAVMFNVLDAAPPGMAVKIKAGRGDVGLLWSAEVAGQDKPTEDRFKPRYDLTETRSGISWFVARGIVEEHGGKLLVSDGDDGWRVEIQLLG